MSDTHPSNIAVIGGGPGGYAAAFLAADLGMTVTLIDPELNPGGVCLYRGCIPSKALLHVANLLEESRQAKNWGIEFAAPKIDLARLRSWKESVVKKLTGGLGQLSKQRKVHYAQGRAAFENSTTVRITKSDGSEETLSFDRIILATGSRPAIVPTLKQMCIRDRFCAAPWSTSAAVVGGFVLGGFVQGLPDKVLSAVTDKYLTYWSAHFPAYLWVLKAILIEHFVLSMSVGCMVALAAKGREMVATMTLSLVLFGLAVPAYFALIAEHWLIGEALWWMLFLSLIHI